VFSADGETYTVAIIIRGVTACPICGDVIADGDALVSTTHFIHDETHELYRYSDSAMHQPCFVRWECRDAFRAAFNKHWPKLLPNHRRQMMEDGSIIPAG